MELDLGLLQDETYSQDARCVWEASRFRLQTYINKKLSLHGEAQSSLPIRKMSCYELISFIGNILYALLFRNWLYAPKNRDWLIFQHARCRKNSDGYYVDIYTDDIINEIGIDRCVIIEKPYLWRHLKPTKRKVYYFEVFYIFSIFIGFLTSFYSKHNLASIKNMVHDIETYLKTRFEIKITDPDRIFRIKTMYVYYMAYLFMLKHHKPKKIMLVVSYGYEPLLWAAQALHIPTVEIMHGVITPEHLGYSMPVNMTKILFPDYLLLFGNYWKENMDNFPLLPERLIILGYPYFEKMFTNKSNVSKIENQIIIISQGTIGNELSKFAVKFASLTKKMYRIVYKLHPGEWNRAKTSYSELYEAEEQGLLEIVNTDEPSLYTLFAQSRWQIGVYSTALFEGMAFGCQTILVDLPGVEYMMPLLKKGYAQLVKTPEEIQLNEFTFPTVLREELFASEWRTNWHDFEQINLQCKS